MKTLCITLIAVVIFISNCPAAAAQDQAKIARIFRAEGTDAKGSTKWKQVRDGGFYSISKNDCKLPMGGSKTYQIHFDHPGFILVTINGAYGPDIEISIVDPDQREIVNRTIYVNTTIPIFIKKTGPYIVGTNTYQNGGNPKLILSNEVAH